MNRYALVPLLVLVSLTGCSTVPEAPPLDTTRTFNAPFEEVWVAVVSETSADYPIKNIDKSSGLIASDVVSIDGIRDLRSNGYAPQLLLAVWSQGRETMTVFVSKVDEQRTKVRATLHLEGFDMNASKAWHVWPSRGVLENKLLDRIQTSL